MTTGFVLNGEPVEVEDVHPHLLSALRNGLGITSPKDGCSPSGQCGACTVLVDGKAIASCLVSLEKAEDKAITTLEGFDQVERDRFANAFAVSGALQCGFCTPGIIVRSKALIDQKGADLNRATIEGRLGAHLCRCTGYTKIVDAVELLSSGEEIPVLGRSGNIGGGGVKYEAHELALGDRGFVDDIAIDGMLHAALSFTDHARADVVNIDTAAAGAAEGVVAVYTAADIPGDLRVGIIHKDWPVMIPEGGRTSYRGDVLAVVVAQDVLSARAAAELVDVTYEVLTPFTDAPSALASDEDAVWGLEGNVLSTSAYTRGDVDAALRDAAHVVHNVFETQRVEHAFLEPESTVAVPGRNGSIHVYSGGQGVWDDRDQIAAMLAIETSAVTVELVSNGGAFGGKEDMSNQGHAALAAHLTGRPVKCTLTRPQSFVMHPKRHPIRVEMTMGCDENGLLTAIRTSMVGDSGPYASVGMKVLERAAGHACGPYAVENVDVEAVAVRTNNPVCGAFRGFGANQAQFATEGSIDRLAEMVGISGWEIRARNVAVPGSVWGPGQVMDDGVRGITECLEAVRPHYDQAVADGKAVGIGAAIKNSGLGNGIKEIAKAVVRFNEDGTVDVRHAWTEMGQGVHTVALQVAADMLGIDPETINVLVDTTHDLSAGQTTGSRGTLMAAGSVEDACKTAIAEGRIVGVDYHGKYTVDWTNSLEDGLENPVIHSAFGYACQIVIADKGTGTIEKVVAAHDVGRVMNPTLASGQVEGSIHMGLGYALTEEFPTDDEGMPTKSTLRQLNIIRPKDMPEVEVILIEVPQPKAPFGVKGVGEIGLVPTAGAVAGAYHAIDGKWRTRLPISVHQPLEIGV
ncbi:MAG: selenium-dependent xanthine dehydrogenase [Actinobacteria bacterium]|nr:MAG: selenium-dependent xanthine dehydrogenase [Actinomycetota bacterium]